MSSLNGDKDAGVFFMDQMWDLGKVTERDTYLKSLKKNSFILIVKEIENLENIKITSESLSTLEVKNL